MNGTMHEPMIHRDGDHIWLTCCEWKLDPASGDPDDDIRWGEWQAAVAAHIADSEAKQ